MNSIPTVNFPPLVQPADAILIDTSDLTIPEVLDSMLMHYHRLHL